MTSFQTVGPNADCLGVDYWNLQFHSKPGRIHAIPGLCAGTRKPGDQTAMETYYPRVSGGSRQAVMCPSDGKGGYDCSKFTSGAPPLKKCDGDSEGAQLLPTVTVLDHFTSSFHWASRISPESGSGSKWYLVTGPLPVGCPDRGSQLHHQRHYDRAAIVEGDWAVVRNSVFVGQSQKDNGL